MCAQFKVLTIQRMQTSFAFKCAYCSAYMCGSWWSCHWASNWLPKLGCFEVSILQNVRYCAYCELCILLSLHTSNMWFVVCILWKKKDAYFEECILGIVLWNMCTFKRVNLRYRYFELCCSKHAYFNVYFKVYILRSVHTLKCVLQSMHTSKHAHFEVRISKMCFEVWMIWVTVCTAWNEVCWVMSSLKCTGTWPWSECTLNLRGVPSDYSIVRSSGHA